MKKNYKVIGIHGNSSSASAFDGFDWCDEAISLPGHDNTPLDMNFNLPNLLSFIRAKIKDDKVVLVGHSLGGNLAFELIKDPNVVAVIASSAPPINNETVKDGWHPHELLGLYFTENLSEEQILELAKFNASTPEGVEKVIEGFKSTVPKIRSDIAASMATGDLNDEVDLVKTSNKPLLLIHGSEDGIVNGDYLRSLNVGTVKTIKGAHSLAIDSPDEYSECVVNFLNQL